ncbi:MAG: hypothetical protein IK012_03020 [Fibrobacter sp.]|uniref:hypothetical protein n=1 Tax=Fibrobacter sp. TaxID=35828 RepID=UPI0025C0D364|nr:hypothetical protein [Fibrobacter sp.]MBR4784209.1 hypothetical protein [Fibrobacter sp.]
MKKFFLTLLASLALCSYSYAQDDDDEYEDDDTPAASSAPSSQVVAPSASTSTSAVKDGGEMLGFGVSLLDAIDDNGVQKFFVTFKLFPDMELSAIFGLYHHGETTRETKNPAGEVDRNDDYTQIQIGVGFDYFIAQILLPISVGGEFLFSHWGEDSNQVTLNAFAGIRANLVSHFYLTGRLGLGFDYISEPVNGDHNLIDSRIDVGLKTQVQLHWFFL